MKTGDDKEVTLQKSAVMKATTNDDGDVVDLSDPPTIDVTQSRLQLQHPSPLPSQIVSEPTEEPLKADGEEQVTGFLPKIYK